jgi:hypothetical protein
LLRPLLGALLVIGLLVPLIVQPVWRAPADLPGELVAVSRWIQDLPSGTPVLVAVDYPAASTAEMELAASPVLEHLINREAHLVMVSTSATGPLLAERLMDQVYANRLSRNPNAQPYRTVTNLGWIPAGPTGLSGFAKSPSVFTPAVFQAPQASLANPWEEAPLTELDDLNQFGMILVVTESPQTARDWIEQVRPVVKWTPIIMVLSVQAEPLVRPYFETQPSLIQGMIIGIAGGAGYEELAGYQAAAVKAWPIYVLGNWIAAIAILILIGIFLFYSWYGQRRAAPTVSKGQE